jgi:hypothetical protein
MEVAGKIVDGILIHMENKLALTELTRVWDALPPDVQRETLAAWEDIIIEELESIDGHE